MIKCRVMFKHKVKNQAKRIIKIQRHWKHCSAYYGLCCWDLYVIMRSTKHKDWEQILWSQEAGVWVHRVQFVSEENILKACTEDCVSTLVNMAHHRLTLKELQGILTLTPQVSKNLKGGNLSSTSLITPIEVQFAWSLVTVKVSEYNWYSLQTLQTIRW